MTWLRDLVKLLVTHVLIAKVSSLSKRSQEVDIHCGAVIQFVLWERFERKKRYSY